MRGFECHYFYYNQKELVKCSNTSCWAGIRLLLDQDIYISKYDDRNTKKYQNKLIALINEITPCEKVVIKSQEYIRFRTLNNYDKSLILLNFIRNLWNEPYCFSGYAKRFFDALDNSDNIYEDALQRLTWANKEACKGATYNYGHSNCFKQSSLRIKTSKQLKNARCFSTSGFLTR